MTLTSNKNHSSLKLYTNFANESLKWDSLYEIYQNYQYCLLIKFAFEICFENN